MINKFLKISLFISSLFAIQELIAQTKDNVIDKVVWVVGDEAILKSEVEEERMGMLMNGQRIEGDPYCIIPEQLAVRKLYLDQAKIDSIEVGASILNKEVARREKLFIANVGGGSKEKLEEYWGMNITQIREKLYEQIKTEMTVDDVQHSLTKGITLTPSEVRKYYNQLPKDSLPYIETTVEVQIITNQPVIPLKEIDAVKEKLRDFTNRINSGETDFATLAIMYSEDGSAINGGELGFSGRAALDPAFSNVAFALPDNKKVSNIVESDFGYHIIQLIERRGDRANFRHIILKPKVPYSSIEASKEKLQNLADSIRAGSIEFNDAVKYLSHDADTRNSEGLMVNVKAGYNGYPISTSRFKLEELPPAIAKVVDTLKVGEISAPIVYKNEKNQKDVVAIVKLKSRIEGHVANVNDDYEELRQIVEMRKKEDVLKKWVARKIKEVYTYVDENWSHCTFKFEGWGQGKAKSK